MRNSGLWNSRYVCTIFLILKRQPSPLRADLKEGMLLTSVPPGNPAIPCYLEHRLIGISRRGRQLVAFTTA